MALVTESILVDSVVALVVIGFCLYLYFKSSFEYWDRKGIPNTKRNIILESFIKRQQMGEIMTDIYQNFKNEKFYGSFFFSKPLIVVRDADLIHRILVKDFLHFQDRGGPPKLKNDTINENLFNLKGRTWRSLRYKLTPTFSTGKLKGMFEQVLKCGEKMISKVEDLIKNEPELEPKHVLFEYTTDVISSCAFGIQFEPNSRDFNFFKSAIMAVFNPTFIQQARQLFVMFLPKLAELLGMSVNFDKKVVDYFQSLIKNTSKYRKEHNIQRNDYLQLLLNLQEQEKSGQGLLTLPASDTTEDDDVIDQMKFAGENDDLEKEEKLLSDERVVANSVIFLVAGSESVSSTVNWTLLELAKHPEIQERVQEEVDRVLAAHGGHWSYQTVKDMTYLDQVIQEVQRLNPLIPFLIRECTRQYVVPDCDLVLEKGTLVNIPVAAIQRDPQYYNEPDEFRPERFEGNNFKPNPTFLPFGDGPRICIAMRFAVLEVKMSMAKIMEKFTVKLSPKTQMPIKLEPLAFIPTVKGGLWLKFEKRKKTVN